MRWSLLNCLLLAIIALASANERPKRSIGYIKNLIGTTLFGSSPSTTSNVVYARLLAKNDTHKLLSIPGQNYNILIKVSNNTKSEEDKEKENPKVNRIVTPEIAILGTYLGTKTEAETLLAIEMAKSLIKSGVLTENLLRKVIIETKEKIMQPLNIYTQERDPLFILPPERVNTPLAVFPVEVPPLVIAPEVAIRPVQNKYSYKQFGHEADMKYESYNGKDVIVTRTTKEPPVPEFIKRRLQEVAINGGIPYMSLPVAVEAVPPVNNVPIPYLYRRPAIVTPEFVSTVPNPALDMYIDSKPILFSQPTSLRDAVKLLPSNNGHVNINSLNSQVQTDSRSVKIQGTKENMTYNNKKQNVHDILNQNAVNGQIVSKYSYKQMYHNNPGQNTEIRIENPSKVNSQETETQKIAPSKDLVYVPPKNVNIPSPVGSSSQAKSTSTISSNQFKNDIYTNSKTVPFVSKAPQIIFKTSQSGSLNSNPIVVAENKEGSAVIEVNTNVNEIKTIEETRRGDIPEPIH